MKNDINPISNNSAFQLFGFRTCTKVSGPIRVYLETGGKLRSVYSPRDGKHKASHRCFHAKKQPAALYIEAEESSEYHDARLQCDLELRYIDSRKEISRRFNDEEEDCRPCSMDELAKAYCQSDFIARGTVSAVQKQPNLEAAELILRVTKILRRIEENEVQFSFLLFNCLFNSNYILYTIIIFITIIYITIIYITIIYLIISWHR